MAQTKRKRRNKHRGNAVGAVEARGRTSKPAASGKGRATTTTRGGRPARPLKQPTLNGAALKALFGVVILFIFFQISAKDVSTSQSVFMCLVAFVLYTPLMYLTDKWIYSKKLKQMSSPPRG